MPGHHLHQGSAVSLLRILEKGGGNLYPAWPTQEGEKGLEAKGLDNGPGKIHTDRYDAWHKYWFLEELRRRDDIVIRNLNEFTDPKRAVSNSDGP